MNRNNLIKSMLGFGAAVAFTASVQALPITGTISYISATVPNNANLNLATSFAFMPVGIVVSSTGDLAGVGGTVLNAPAVSGLPLGIGPAPAAVPVLGLWSGGTFNFDLLSLNVDFRSATQFTASGTGTITALGFDPTPGTWTLAITGSGPVIGFAAGTQALGVPDAGSSVCLLGLGLASLGFYRRQQK
jgi:hypothetical protein